jgi:hypothetical protein
VSPADSVRALQYALHGRPRPIPGVGSMRCQTRFFRSSKPGPKGSRKTRTVRDRVLVLRAEDQSVTEIVNALTAQGSPVSAQTVWAIVKSEGLERLNRRRPAGPASRLKPAKAKAIGHWPTGARNDCDHAGLCLLLPAMAELGPGPSPDQRQACVDPGEGIP